MTQNTSWTNVVKALAQLKRAKVMSMKALRQLPQAELAQLIYSSGYYNQKAKKIKNLIYYIDSQFDGRFGNMQKMPLDQLRASLLTIHGIGRETADTIILYCLNRRIFVIDAYTMRIFSRLGILDKQLSSQSAKTYDSVQRLFMLNLPEDTELYNDFHAQIVYLGHHFCKPKPLCQECPLNKICERKLLTD